MKKTILSVALAGLSLNVIAAPYVGIEYGIGSTSHDVQSNFKQDPNVKLDPALEDGILSGFVGYQLTPSWAVELGYSQYDLDGSRSFKHPYQNDGIERETEWDSSVKAKQFMLTPVYTFDLSDKWLTKVKAGLTYTQYDISNSKTYEEEHIVTDVEQNRTLEHNSRSSNEIGGLVFVGAEYKVLPQLTLGANVKYQFDSFANTASFNIGSTYYF